MDRPYWKRDLREEDDAVVRYQEIYDAYQPPDAKYLTRHRGHLMFLRPEEEPFITGEMIRQVTMTGTVPELRERLQALAKGGYSQWVIQVVPGHEDALEDWARVIEAI